MVQHAVSIPFYLKRSSSAGGESREVCNLESAIFPQITFWAQTHMHLSDLKFEVPQVRTAYTLRLQNSSNNIKNYLLLRKEDFLLKRQTKGIRLTEIFKNLAKNTLSEHTSGAEEEQHFFY